MSEQTYTHIVQAVVLVIFVLGLMYADPAVSAFAQRVVTGDATVDEREPILNK